MSPSYTERVNSNDRWFKIVRELLSPADIQINGSRSFDIVVHHPDFYKYVLQQGSLGLGESYMAGWWDCERLDIFFFKVIRAGLENSLPKRMIDIARIALARLFNFQSKTRAWVVGKRHYDLGNELFEAILDKYMQYSCGYWKEARNLEEAQIAKLHMICRKLQLQPGMRLLDIGCGWGGLSAFAAKHYGVSVDGVTISGEQQKLAQERCKDLPVNILLQDYRDIHSQYDRIVSVGMFEHVGPKNYKTFFNVVAQNLKENGLFLLHTIGSRKTGPGVDPWIEKYIFPNGCLPSIAYIAKNSESFFIMEDLHNFGADYDCTLMAWYKHFMDNWDSLSSHYNQVFQRMFHYYLNACAGAFRARDIQLWQILFSPKGVMGGVRVFR